MPVKRSSPASWTERSRSSTEQRAPGCDRSHTRWRTATTRCTVPASPAFQHDVSRLSTEAQRVVEPLRALAADAVVDLLRPVVVLGRLPGELAGAALPRGVGAGLDQRLRGAAP